jgi:hypothetical protein
MRISIRCIICGNTSDLIVNEKGYDRWKSGELIQNALPELSNDERELLISKCCEKCFDSLLGEDEDE